MRLARTVALVLVITGAAAAVGQDTKPATLPATTQAVPTDTATPVDQPVLSPAVRDFLVNLTYAIAAIFFVFGLKMLSSPRTARRGNLVASLGMLIAVVVTLASKIGVDYTVIVAGFVVGGLIGLIAARMVPMTGMPEMVALFNGSGGLASAVVAMAEYWKVSAFSEHLLDGRITIGLTLLIGMLTCTGSLVAFGKLRGMTIRGVRLGNPLVFPLQHALNLLLLLAVVACGVALAMNPASWWAALLIIVAAAALGVLMTLPIGGADMPVVVSLLNSYSGLAACAAGFVLHNTGLIISGSLVGASGLILTKIMCKAMNRSLINVMAGGFGQDVAVAGGRTLEGQTVRQMDAEEATMVLEAAQKVFVIPGYGMAVAQAQHAVAEMANLLTQKGVEVKYGVHPVAGRMPGHMNVLLAEANVPYEQLADLELNGEMDQCDVALVIGANDVVNPDARRPDSQIAGMPIFDVDKARTVMVCKRSLNPGFAGIQNPLFFNENTVMLFGDAKKMVSSIVGELKGD